MSEYIGQLESEIATKVSENGDLRAQNRALAEENRRLSDLTRMLLSSPSFSNFLDHLSQNPAAHPQQPQQQQQQQQPAPKIERQPEPQQVPKDANPYTATQHTQQQTVGMVMIPEQAMDFSMLNIENESFNYQPQVFTVLETPDMPQFDASVLSGKACSTDDDVPASDDEKVEAHAIESPVSASMEDSQVEESSADTICAKVTDLDGDIYDDEITASHAPAKLDISHPSMIDIFGGIEPEKAFARYELVDASEEELAADMVAKRVERLSASLEASLSKLERLTIGL